MALSVSGAASFLKGSNRVILAVHVADSNGSPLSGLTESNFRVSKHDLGIGIEPFDNDDFWILDLNDIFTDDFHGVYHISLPPAPDFQTGQTIYLVRVSFHPIEQLPAGFDVDFRSAIENRPLGRPRPVGEPRVINISEQNGLVLVPLVLFGDN